LDELLSELEELADRIRDHSEQLAQIYREVMSRSKGMAAMLAHWEDQAYADPAPLKDASQELRMVLHAIETALVRAPERARLETVLKEKLAEFIDRHADPSKSTPSLEEKLT
jgi:hypothetical protein